MKNFILSLIFIMLPDAYALAQMWDRLGADSLRIDTADSRTLKVKVNALSFFRDNEYDSEVTKGYTLPGVWLRPSISYNPTDNIHLELGANALIYNGANKYPNYAYHDIATWKGSQYQSGTHILPWFRGQLDLKNVSFVFGNIYGAQNHRFITPMYNPEQLLSADPEMGFQVVYERPMFSLDAFINWQSYIFEEDSHQEAFTVGVVSRVKWNKVDSQTHFYTPFQVLIQHRGGEQDTTSMGVQTICNASLGVGMHHKVYGKVLTAVEAQANILACYQQAGKLWPFDTGTAFNAETGVTLMNNLDIHAGFFHAPCQFVSLYGNPYFSTISVKNPGIVYKGMNTIYMGIDYSRTFASHYTFGANLEAFSNHSKGGMSEFNFSFGVYFRVNPSFIIKKW